MSDGYAGDAPGDIREGEPRRRPFEPMTDDQLRRLCRQVAEIQRYQREHGLDVEAPSEGEPNE